MNRQREIIESSARASLLSTLDTEIQWHWRWEKKYRRWYYATNWVSWLSSFVILILSFYQIQLGSTIQQWVILTITILSMLSVSLPVLCMNFKFQQRQEVYDRKARAYSLLHTKLLTGTLSVEASVKEFEKIHLQPTEKLIRETA